MSLLTIVSCCSQSVLFRTQGSEALLVCFESHWSETWSWQRILSNTQVWESSPFHSLLRSSSATFWGPGWLSLGSRTVFWFQRSLRTHQDGRLLLSKGTAHTPSLLLLYSRWFMFRSQVSSSFEVAYQSPSRSQRSLISRSPSSEDFSSFIAHSFRCDLSTWWSTLATLSPYPTTELPSF